MRLLIGTIMALLIVAVLVTAAAGEVPVGERNPMAIDAKAPVAPPPLVKPSKPIEPAPRIHPPRVKPPIERFVPFEPDQRTIS